MTGVTWTLVRGVYQCNWLGRFGRRCSHLAEWKVVGGKYCIRHMEALWRKQLNEALKRADR